VAKARNCSIFKTMTSAGAPADFGNELEHCFSDSDSDVEKFLHTHRKARVESFQKHFTHNATETFYFQIYMCCGKMDSQRRSKHSKTLHRATIRAIEFRLNCYKLQIYLRLTAIIMSCSEKISFSRAFWRKFLSQKVFLRTFETKTSYRKAKFHPSEPQKTILNLPNIFLRI
jgi:hypothetical protein